VFGAEKKKTHVLFWVFENGKWGENPMALFVLWELIFNKLQYSREDMRATRISTPNIPIPVTKTMRSAMANICIKSVNRAMKKPRRLGSIRVDRDYFNQEFDGTIYRATLISAG
jgi:hypothetical protein